MTVNRYDHCLLEQALYDAFPQEPLPALAWPARSQLEFAAQAFLKNKRWPEAVGLRLTWGELDPSLSGWIEALPSEVVRYFLPSHLMLASLMLAAGDASNYAGEVMEAFLLPPPDPAGYAEFDEALFVTATLDMYAGSRMDLYRLLTPAQRACVARYLDLYAAHRAAEFTERGRELYAANRDVWLNSSLFA